MVISLEYKAFTSTDVANPNKSAVMSLSFPKKSKQESCIKTILSNLHLFYMQTELLYITVLMQHYDNTSILRKLISPQILVMIFLAPYNLLSQNIYMSTPSTLIKPFVFTIPKKIHLPLSKMLFILCPVYLNSTENTFLFSFPSQ